jgi:precorrin-3B methylase
MTVATVILAKVLAWQRLTVEVTPGVPAAAAERAD